MGVLIHDRDFSGVVAAARTAASRGETLRSWWNASPPITMLPLPDSRPQARMDYFFSTLEIDGKPTSVMGCLQRSDFQRRAGLEQPPVSLSEWVATNFMRQCRWTHPDGSLRGFRYRPALVLDRSGERDARRVEEDLDFKLCEIGTHYEWAAVRLDALDYMRAFPVVGRYSKLLEPLNREAGYMLLHPSFFKSPQPQPAGCVEEYCFAYSVVPWTVMPTIAAYGPGRFFAAFKQFRFFLMEDGTVSIEVLFLVAPRCQRVFNILGFDPVLGMAGVLDAITLKRARINARAHDAVDRFALGHHGRIHHNMLAGLRRIWEETNWQPADGQRSNSSSGR